MKKSYRQELAAGALDLLPVSSGVLFFGMVVSVSSIEAGFTEAEALLASLVIFAASSQAAIAGLAEEASFLAIVFAAVAVNARFVIYSAALARTFRTEGLLGRVLYPYFLADPNFAATMKRNEGNDREAGGNVYYLGASLVIWISFQAGTVLGVVFGKGLPDGLHLGFLIPLFFAAMVVPAIDSRGKALAAVSSAVAAIALKGGAVPGAVALYAAVLVGMAVGCWDEWRLARRRHG